MKKILTHSLIALLFTMTLWSCQDLLEKDFYNPEEYAASEDRLAAGLFTNTLYSWQIYVQDYGEWWWGLGGWSHTSYAQISLRPLIEGYAPFYEAWDDITTGNGFSADNNIRNYFNSMYTKMKTWSLIKDFVEKKYTEEEIKDSYVYYQLLTVIKEYVMLRNVDIFNSIPYKKAIQGNNNILFVEYDDPLEIYKTALTNLEEIATTLQANYDKMSDEGKSLFEKQDIAFKGNIQTWKEYVNALRLRYAIRMSAKDEAFAKKQISSAIAGGLPTVDMIWDLPIKQASVLPGGGTIVRSWYERFTTLFIPNVILERMNHDGSDYKPGIDDPRLPAIAAPTRYNDYRGVRMDSELHKAEDVAIRLQSDDKRPDGISDLEWKRLKYYINRSERYEKADLTPFKYNCLSMYNPATYMYCEVPAYMMSMAEVDLLLAEVAAKGLATTGKTAGKHLYDAITHSTPFWYNINSKTVVDKVQFADFCPKLPSDGDIQKYASWLENEYNKLSGIENQMEMIMQQKYIHLNLFNSVECWTELRRTRHPKLEPVRFLPYFERSVPQVERIKYPESEEINNTENFMKVKKDDNYTSPIFWVSNNNSYYRDSYIEIEYIKNPK